MSSSTATTTSTATTQAWIQEIVDAIQLQGQQKEAFETAAKKSRDFGVQMLSKTMAERQTYLPEYDRRMLEAFQAKVKFDAQTNIVGQKIFEYAIQKKGDVRMLAAALFPNSVELQNQYVDRVWTLIENA